MTKQQNKNLKIGAAILGGAILIYIVSGKSDSGGSAEDPTGNGPGNTGGTIGNVFNAHSVAVALYEAMKDTGTDENEIVSILSTVNNTQFGLVVKAFGKLAYNETTGNQYGWGTLPKVDLKGWLKSELSAGEYNNLRRKYPNYL